MSAIHQQQQQDQDGIRSPRGFTWWASCDRYMLVYVILCFLGAGILWPYNTLVSVPDYFNHLFPDANLEFLIPAVLNYPALVLLLIMVKYGKKMSFRYRIMSCFVVFAIVALAIPIVGSSMPRNTPGQSRSALTVVILLIFCAGTFTAVLQSSLFGFTSAFPILYTQALMGGNGWAGFIVTLMRVFTKLAYPDDADERSANLYFIISAAFSGLCLALFLAMERLPFAKQFLDKQNRLREASRLHNGDSQEEAPLVQDNESLEAQAEKLTRNESGEFNMQKQTNFKEIFSKVWRNGLVVFGVFTLTFMIFPGLSASLKSTNGWSQDWFTLALFVEFNFFDVIGRSLPSYFLLFKRETLWIASLSRFLLYPLFVLNYKQVFFVQDYWCFIFMAIFALSNGYVASLAMMYGPTYVEKDQDKETAGFIMSCFLTFGIFAGSHIALILQTVL